MVGAFGGRGVGKTTWVRDWIERQRAPCVAMWDYKRDPKMKDFGQVYTDLAEFIEALRAQAFCVRYQPDLKRDIHQQFKRFCQAMWLIGHRHPIVFIDELPAVTRANKAPDDWRNCVNIGREYEDAKGRACSLTIVITAQRVAEIDKSTLSNCDIVHTGRVRGGDADVLAGELGVKADELKKLQDFHWVELGPGDLEARRGVLGQPGTVVGRKTTETVPKAAKKAPAKTPAKRRP